MYWKVIKITHILTFVLGCSVTLYLVNLSTEGSFKRQNEGEGYFVIVLILSSPSNIKRREVIRQTWATLLPSRSTKYLFALGDRGLSTTLSSLIDEEQKSYNDILFLPIQDAYKFLTLKVLKSFVYLEANYKYDFVLKCDDDTFVNVKPFLTALEGLRNEPRLYWGYFQGRGHVFTSGIWKETKWFLCDKYVPYAYGGGYILSRKLVTFIANNADMLSIYNSEDISVASWLAGLDLHRKHDVLFDTAYRSRGCRNSFLLAHKRSPQEILTMFSNIKATGVLCAKEYDTSLVPYSYNWSALPAQCCQPLT